MKNSVGERIKLIRSETELNQHDFADSIGISRSRLAQVETDRIQPTLETLTMIVRKYNKTYEYLIEGHTSEDTSKDTSKGKNQNRIAHISESEDKIKELEIENIRLKAQLEAYLNVIKTLGGPGEGQKSKSA